MNRHRHLTHATILVLLSIAITAMSPLDKVSAALGGNPTDVTADSKDGTASATIRWTAPTGTTRYRVRAYIGNVAVKTSGILAAPRSNFTFTGLEYGIPYSLKVQAGDASSWGTETDSTPATVTPEAAAPSAPGQPTVDVLSDKKLRASWTEPDSTGGAVITAYLVQVYQSGKRDGDEKRTTATSLDLTTGDSTSTYTVTVKAVNAMSKTSPSSEESKGIVPTVRAATLIADSPSSGNTGNTGNTGDNQQNANPPMVAAPPATGGTSSSPTASTASGSTATPSYAKTVTLKSRTSTKTLLALSKLTVPKGATLRYSVVSSSVKICTKKGTIVIPKKTGTCAVIVGVYVNGKKKNYRTVRLHIVSAK